MSDARLMLLPIQHELDAIKGPFESHVLQLFHADESELQRHSLEPGADDRGRAAAEYYLISGTRGSGDMHPTGPISTRLETTPTSPLEFEQEVGQEVRSGILAWEQGMFELSLAFFDSALKSWQENGPDDGKTLYYALINKASLLISLYKHFNQSVPYEMILKEMHDYQIRLEGPLRTEYRYFLLEHMSRLYLDSGQDYASYVALKREAMALIEQRRVQDEHYPMERYLDHKMNLHLDLGMALIGRSGEKRSGSSHLAEVLTSRLSETSQRTMTREYDLFRKGQANLWLGNRMAAEDEFDRLLKVSMNHMWGDLVQNELEKARSRGH